MTPENGWDEYQNLVLYRLDNLDKAVSNMRSEVMETRISLERKSSLWGAIGGAIAGVGAALIGTLWPPQR